MGVHGCRAGHDAERADVLVIGAGAAGWRAALAARREGADVLVVSKYGPEAPTATTSAWGGITYSTVDLAAELFRQVVVTGGFLNDQRLVEVLVRDTPGRVEELAGFGVESRVLDHADRDGRLGLVKVPGEVGLAGWGLLRPLRAACEAAGVRVRTDTVVSSLAVAGGRVVGAYGVDAERGRFVTIAAGAVVLATGGGACLYERNDNPAGGTGDGMALAYEAGAELVDLEFVSFNFPSRSLADLLRRGVRDPRDLEHGHAHYFLGGVRIDEEGATTVPGLFAAGEVTGGLLGAARLGGSALADTLVFGALAGRQAARSAQAGGAAGPAGDPPWADLAARLCAPGVSVDQPLTALRRLMWQEVGVSKTRESLEQAVAGIRDLRERAATVTAGDWSDLRTVCELRHQLTLAGLVADASRRREETRGAFWRVDFPTPDNANWLRNSVVRRMDGGPHWEFRPPVMTRLREPTEPRIGAGCFGYLPPPSA